MGSAELRVSRRQRQTGAAVFTRCRTEDAEKNSVLADRLAAQECEPCIDGAVIVDDAALFEAVGRERA